MAAASRRRHAALLLGLGGLTFAPAAWAGDFVDSAGRTVKLPAAIERVVPAGVPADALLFAIAPEKLIGLTEPFGPRKKEFVPPAFRDLPAIPRVTRTVTSADLEAIKNLKAGLIVDYGDITPAYVATADRVSGQTGLPYVILSGYLADTPDIARKLGHILCKDARSETVAKAGEDILARLRPLDELPNDRRVPVYYGRGEDGLRAARPGTTLAQAIEFAGGRNVVPAGDCGFADMTVDQVKALAPAVVVVANPKAAAPDSPLRNALPATTKFYVDRGRPFGWMENPPSLNRLIGALWLASKLHPDLAKFDAAQAKALSGSLLGLDLTDEQVGQMMR